MYPSLVSLLAFATIASAQPAVELPLILQITWHKGPNLPQGFQDSDGGMVGGHLVTVGGFCQGRRDVPGKEHVYPRGFLKKAWGLDLSSPEAGWGELPDLPGPARQELCAIAVDDRLYCCGGFSYDAPYCYRDGYRLYSGAEGWSWEALPELPWPVGGAGICAIGSRVYVMGGADYDLEGFHTDSDRAGGTPGLGARLLWLDTEDLQAGWRELAQCPGTPRWVHACAAVGGKVYVIGGATGDDNAAGTYCTVVDNWCYDPATDTWERLADTPISSGNFPAGQIVFRDRYIILIGGCQYPLVMRLDGTTTPAYGETTRHYPDNPYFSDVFVYDVQEQAFGRATPLPLNNNLPMAVVSGDTLHLIGGETGGAQIEGEAFGHHPELYLVGDMEARQPGGRTP